MAALRTTTTTFLTTVPRALRAPPLSVTSPRLGLISRSAARFSTTTPSPSTANPILQANQSQAQTQGQPSSSGFSLKGLISNPRRRRALLAGLVVLAGVDAWVWVKFFRPGAKGEKAEGEN